MATIPIQDKRGFFVLPQGFEGGGYYTYGTPNHGRSQYAHPRRLTLIQFVATRWCVTDSRKFGIGNLSLADGVDLKRSRNAGCFRQLDVEIVARAGRDQPEGIVLVEQRLVGHDGDRRRPS